MSLFKQEGNNIVVPIEINNEIEKKPLVSNTPKTPKTPKQPAKKKPKGEVYKKDLVLGKSGTNRNGMYQPLKIHIPMAITLKYDLKYQQEFTITQFKDKVVITIERDKK